MDRELVLHFSCTFLATLSHSRIYFFGDQAQQNNYLYLLFYHSQSGSDRRQGSLCIMVLVCSVQSLKVPVTLYIGLRKVDILHVLTLFPPCHALILMSKAKMKFVKDIKSYTDLKCVKKKNNAASGNLCPSV